MSHQCDAEWSGSGVSFGIRSFGGGVVGRLGFEWCLSTSNTISNAHFYQLHVTEVSRLGFQYSGVMDLYTVDMG